MSITSHHWVDPVEVYLAITGRDTMWSWAFAHGPRHDRPDPGTVRSGLTTGTPADAVCAAMGTLLDMYPASPVDLYCADQALVSAVEELRHAWPHIESHHAGATHRLAHLATTTARTALHGTRPAPPRQVVAVDGSWGARTHHGSWAVLTDTGRWACEDSPRVASPLVAEVHAIALALRITGDRPVQILCDSQTAIRLVHGPVAPVGLSHPLTVIRRQLPGRDVQLTWVPGHTGHALNEGADRLAVAARRCGELATPHTVRDQICAQIAADMSLAHRTGQPVAASRRPGGIGSH